MSSTVYQKTGVRPVASYHPALKTVALQYDSGILSLEEYTYWLEEYLCTKALSPDDTQDPKVVKQNDRIKELEEAIENCKYELDSV